LSISNSKTVADTAKVTINDYANRKSLSIDTNTKIDDLELL